MQGGTQNVYIWCVLSPTGDFLNDQKVTKESLGVNLVRLALLVSQKFSPSPPLDYGGVSRGAYVYIRRENTELTGAV